jgi:hypothetical protein
MQAIALVNQKGGVGKTTLALHLATAFAAAGRNTLVLDLDPQASAAEWKAARVAETPPVMAVPAARLAKVLEEAKKIGTEVAHLRYRSAQRGHRAHRRAQRRSHPWAPRAASRSTPCCRGGRRNADAIWRWP